MKAIVFHKFGSPNVLELSEVDKPVATDDEVLDRIHASSLNLGEWHAMTGLHIARTQFKL
jgi:NADPH:quinone reductase-like Zn-dependent oxidoreductase